MVFILYKSCCLKLNFWTNIPINKIKIKLITIYCVREKKIQLCIIYFLTKYLHWEVSSMCYSSAVYYYISFSILFKLFKTEAVPRFIVKNYICKIYVYLYTVENKKRKLLIIIIWEKTVIRKYVQTYKHCVMSDNHMISNSRRFFIIAAV